MKRLHPIALLLLLSLSLISISSPALAQDPPGTALITGCKSGSLVGAYRKPGLAVRTYARFSCGSSVFVWNATSKTALVQQGMTVAFVPAKYIFDAGTSKGASPAAVRTFLQAIAEGSSSARWVCYLGSETARAELFSDARLPRGDLVALGVDPHRKGKRQHGTARLHSAAFCRRHLL